MIPALLLALMRLSKKKAIQCVSGAYIAVFRSTPLLVQLSIIYFGLFTAISIPRITIWGFVDLSRFIPGVVALALNSSAYVAEIFRAGILAVDKGQTEAAGLWACPPGRACAWWCCPRLSRMCCLPWPTRW